MKTPHTLWDFFASVKLALFIIGCLAVTSIAGTIIPQNESVEFYVGRYGLPTTQFFQLFSLTDMYSSWWFLSLLGLLSLNLLVCSIDRFPAAWQQITRDNLGLPIERIEKIRLAATLHAPLAPQEIRTKLLDQLAARGWKAQVRQRDEGLLFFSEKMAWSRLGVYVVHLSILVIFAGAIYGQVNGFKGGIMLPERQSSGVVYPFDAKVPIDLGFEVRCDRFAIEFYPNNMPKEFTSALTILEDGKEVLHKDIEVNAPLTYRGITFYQSSYQAFNDFLFTVAAEDSAPQTFAGDYQKEISWEGQGVHFGVINLETVRDRVVRMKIWFNDNKGEPAVFWMNDGETVPIERYGTTYSFSAKQRYATGLQVAKDPGVWLVYLGCTLMLLGLYVAFFLSHRRIWCLVRARDGQTVIDIRGSANKNKEAFDGQFNTLSEALRKTINTAR